MIAQSESSDIVHTRSRSNSHSSSASLTSSSSFDPHEAPPASPSTEERRPSALGIRDIQKLYRADKVEKALQKEREEARPIDVQHESSSSRGDLTNPLGGRAGEVFAADVNVRGWRIIGGRKWSGDAKVGAYVVYDIEITNRNGGEIEILRRYTDFVKLRSALKSRFPDLQGAIPSLPGKNHMSKFSDKLLEDRKPRLQRFLRTVMLHPEMGRGGVGSVIGEWVLSGTTTSAGSKSKR